MIILTVIVLAVGVAGYKYYKYIYNPVVHLQDSTVYFYIYQADTYQEVRESLFECGIITDFESFDWVAEKKSYKNQIKPGRYLIKDGMSNNELVNLLRSGEQEPLNLTFISVRTIEQLAGRIGQQIAVDSVEILEYLTNPEIISHYGFNKNTFISMFIPNTYQMYWNTGSEEFVQRMADEFMAFWSEERLEKARSLGYSQSQVSTLASIVEQETQKNDEKSRIAGVYINRLNKGMKLQADPTVIYAAGDFSIRRVLYRHLEIDSPYNTYKYTGLPPGPICIPSISSIDAVLNYETHSYIFFCAREDFSGYHNFARTLTQHNVNARKFQRALNNSGIY